MMMIIIIIIIIIFSLYTTFSVPFYLFIIYMIYESVFYKSKLYYLRPAQLFLLINIVYKKFSLLKVLLLCTVHLPRSVCCFRL